MTTGPVPLPPAGNPDLAHDMGVARTKADVIDEGGCSVKENVYENGESWHPTVLPQGKMECVTCQCKVCVQYMYRNIYIGIYAYQEKTKNRVVC